MKTMVVDDFLEQGKPKHLLLKYVDLPRSSYYYVSTGTKPGKRPCGIVRDLQENCYDLEYISDCIKSLLAEEFVDYGYYKTYRYLKDELGLQIGSYRTYRIIKEKGLLKFQRDKKKRTNRIWVKDLVPVVESEFSFLEFDIKYVYIHGKRTNAQVLSIIDLHSRWLLEHHIAYSIKASDVINLFESVIKTYPLCKNFIVRNDNGSQFEAAIVQQYLKEKGITQQFTWPATPQQNAHIESYHSIMESAICQRFEFEDLNDFTNTMNRWKKFYNFDRIHGALNYKSPKKFLESIGVYIDPKWSYIN